MNIIAFPLEEFISTLVLDVDNGPKHINWICKTALWHILHLFDSQWILSHFTILRSDHIAPTSRLDAREERFLLLQLTGTSARHRGSNRAPQALGAAGAFIYPASISHYTSEIEKQILVNSRWRFRSHGRARISAFRSAGLWDFFTITIDVREMNT